MTITRCPVCESDRWVSFLERSHVPVHQNLLVASRAAARTVTRGDIHLAVCEACGFVFNRVFDLSRLAYGADYDASQFYSAYYDAHLDGMAKDLVDRHGVRNSTIVEVGCGRGQFLRKLVNIPGTDNRGVGFDPSYTGADTDLDGRLSFRRSYYDRTCSDVTADVVVCRHVIEHVPEPLTLLRSVRQALANSPYARVFFETPCVEWILKNRVVWDIFYEHCSLFSATSLTLAFERTGFTVKHVAHIFGGQYLWLEAQLTTAAQPVAHQPPDTSAAARAFGANEKRLTQTWLSTLLILKGRGKVALWGAGAKGATFANLIDPDCSLIDCVIDVNPNKHGRFIPGTGHPIVALAELPARGVKFAVLMNANYCEENRKLLTETGIKLELIDWSK